MNIYKCLNTQEFVSGEYKIVPIRLKDRFTIMVWRNEQLYHLRQKYPLTVEDQDNYFSNVVSKIFDEDQPNQILLNRVYFFSLSIKVEHIAIKHIIVISFFLILTPLKIHTYKNNTSKNIKYPMLIASNKMQYILTPPPCLRVAGVKIIDRGGY